MKWIKTSQSRKKQKKKIGGLNKVTKEKISQPGKKQKRKTRRKDEQ